MDELLKRYAAIPPAQRYLIVLLIIAALTGGHYYFIYDDQQRQLANFAKTLAKQQSVVNEKENIAQNRATYEAKLTQLQQQLDEARAKLPDNADVPQLLAQLGSRARQTGLAIESFEPQDEVNKGFYAEIPFKVKATGSYHEVAMFVDAIGKLDRIINVMNLTMDKPKTESSKVIVSATFDVKTYRFTSEDAKEAKGKKK